MNAVLKYPGGKWRISDWIISYFPEHKVYCEPFFGSGAVFFRKEPSYIETINDINGNVVNLFRICRERPEELARALARTPWSREEYESCYEIMVEDPVERARRTVVRYHQSFGTCNANKYSWRNVQTYGGPRCASMWNGLPEIVMSTCERLKNAQIECYDALELIRKYDDPNTLLYLDPPYPLSVRKKGMYRDEMTDREHEQLLEIVLKSRSKIVISSYDNEMYNEALFGWATDEKETIAQMGKHRTEKIYMNYRPAVSQQKQLSFV